MKEAVNRTKIIATLGPASNSKSIIRSLIRSGANILRLNFSHGTHEEHLQRIKIIRNINKEFNDPVGILLDLQGPKIRIGDVVEGATHLAVGQKLIITVREMIGNSQKISTSYQNLPRDVKKGDIILIDDGNIELRVLNQDEEEVVTQVLHGGVLKSKKGINLPDTNVSIPSLTEKDLSDLEFALAHQVDWVALSFVRKAQDINDLRDIINKNGRKTKIVAKIEKPEAVENIGEIIEASDGLMVARGDLGVEIPMEKVPIIQKQIVRKCNNAAKPVIVATQMLESMIQNPRPTRAEASDVANAIMDGADAVMLSGETAAGNYPVLAVRSMARIIRSVEESVEGIFNKNYEIEKDSATFYNDRVIATACQLAEDTNAKVITGMTVTGYTAFYISKHRPKASIIIFTGNKTLLSQLALVWGVRAYFYEKFESTDDALNDIQEFLIKNDLISKKDIYITTGTIPVSSRKRTNTVRLNIFEGQE
ncbi:MAG: pyruvate kinase [Cyclobacteriaceae bacterium]|nr:pyruvate kinase [Cyclobacteriaceae bacterium]